MIMSERLVEIPVERELRDIIRELKGRKTYTQFLADILSKYK